MKILNRVNCLLLLVAGAAVADNRLFEDPSQFDANHPPLMLEVSIPSNGETLTGTYYRASGPGPHPTVISLHAFPGYEKNLDLAQSLRRIGYNVLYFDYRGVWGGPAQFSVTSGYEDAVSAIAFVIDKTNRDRLKVDDEHITLLGHSYGAVAALEVGRVNEEVECIVSLAPEDMTLMISTEDARAGLARYTDNLRVVSGYSGQQLIDDLVQHKEQWAMTTIVETLGDKPFLIIGGGLDRNFDESEVARVVAAGEAADASAITHAVIENGDHSFSAKRIELTEKVASWLDRNCR